MNKHPLDQRFREEVEFTFDSKEGTIGLSGLLYDPIKFLDVLGEEAYETAYNVWKSDDWLPQKRDQLQQWLDNFSCEARFDSLCEAIAKETVTPFIGSGMSVPSGYPLWRDVLIILSKHSKIDNSLLTELLNTEDFETAAFEISSNMPSAVFEECFQNLFPDRRAEPIVGPVCFIPLIFPQSDVITSNFDRVIERAYREEDGHGFQETLYGNHLSHFQRLNAQGRQCIIKIHGDRSWQDFRVLKKEEYNDLYGPEGACSDLLTRFFRNRALLFMGCSLVNDRPLQLFHKLSEGAQGGQIHYAFLNALGGEERLKREHWLAERSIFPIWYEGDHDEGLETLFTVILNRLGRL